MNQKILTMICLEYILILQHLLFWQKNYLKQKIKKNDKFVNLIRSEIIDLKEKIEKMSKNEIEIKKPDKILEIVKKFFEFNKKIQNKSGGGLKILTPNQMLSRLPITLAQLKAGNNSEKT